MSPKFNTPYLLVLKFCVSPVISYRQVHLGELRGKTSPKEGDILRVVFGSTFQKRDFEEIQHYCAYLLFKF